GWRPRMLTLLYKALGAKVMERYLAPHELVQNFITGRSNVLPLDYRIQLDFAGKEGLEKRGELRQKLQLIESGEEGYSEADRLLIKENLMVIDESSLIRQKYTTYLVPRYAPKESMLNQIVAGATDANEMYPHEVSLFVIGDSLTDLRAGCLGGDSRADVTFFVPCGSELGRYLFNREEMFVDVSISWVHDSFEEIEPGVLRFTPEFGYSKRTIIFGDVVFAHMNLTAPESVLACMEEYLPS
ncbi:hypothetical protein KW798_01355, partial [Candidatus Parcubacteria bacterium]|nr:hypothetical protein [Candidatus Parcubacteria bacterium]